MVVVVDDAGRDQVPRREDAVVGIVEGLGVGEVELQPLERRIAEMDHRQPVAMRHGDGRVAALESAGNEFTAHAGVFRGKILVADAREDRDLVAEIEGRHRIHSALVFGATIVVDDVAQIIGLVPSTVAYLRRPSRNREQHPHHVDADGLRQLIVPVQERPVAVRIVDEVQHAEAAAVRDQPGIGGAEGVQHRILAPRGAGAGVIIIGTCAALVEAAELHLRGDPVQDLHIRLQVQAPGERAFMRQCGGCRNRILIRGRGVGFDQLREDLRGELRQVAEIAQSGFLLPEIEVEVVGASRFGIAVRQFEVDVKERELLLDAQHVADDVEFVPGVARGIVHPPVAGIDHLPPVERPRVAGAAEVHQPDLTGLVLVVDHERSAHAFPGAIHIGQFKGRQVRDPGIAVVPVAQIVSHAEVVRAQIPLLRGCLEEDTERVIHEPFFEGPDEPVVGARVLEIVEASLDSQFDIGEPAELRIDEREHAPGGLAHAEVHHATDQCSIHIRGDRFGDLDATQHAGGDHAQVLAAVAHGSTRFLRVATARVILFEEATLLGSSTPSMVT